MFAYMLTAVIVDEVAGVWQTKTVMLAAFQKRTVMP